MAPDPTPGPTPADGRLAARLLPVAQDALRRHDLAAWVQAYDGTADEPQPDERYEARRELIRDALAHHGGSRAQAAARFLIVAGRLVRTLEEEPREPVLLNEAGVAFYELGALEPAEALFRAARRLDPVLPGLDRNLHEIGRRRATGVTRLDGLPGDVAAGLRQLGPRALRIAASAQPAEGQTVALCMIVKDEEAMLGRCLAAVRDWVDEIVVVDTGSTDRTVEIALEHGARVLHREWQNDFSAARNVAFDAATTDWVVVLDADEVLVDGDGPKLRELLGHTWREALFFVETNYTGALDDGTATTHDAMRLFRHRPTRRYKGRLHEQVQDVPDYLPERLEVSTVRIEHFGYLGEVREEKDKVTRNRALIEQQLAEGDDTPFLRFNLGMEHVAADDVATALPHLEEAWGRLRPDPARGTYGFTPMLASHLVDALRAMGRLDDAEERALEILELYPAFTDVVLQQAQIARLRDDDERAERHFRRCLELGDAPSTYVATVGAGTFLAARDLAELLVDHDRLDEAESLLADTLRRHPDHLRTAQSLTTLLLRRGVSPTDAVARIEGLVPDLSPAGRFLVASALHRAGAVTEGESQLRAVLAERPGTDAARIQLVESLLAQDRLADALVEASLVPVGSPREDAALRHAAFAGLAAGLPVSGVLDRAATVLPTPEVDLLRAWAGEDASPAAEAAGFALTMLSALARLERFEAFEALAAVFERADLPWRTRREELARLYLRRGFLQSAADEWMLVVREQGPDADALNGLAIVAAEMGMDEDAAIFAADAEALAAS